LASISCPILLACQLVLPHDGRARWKGFYSIVFYYVSPYRVDVPDETMIKPLHNNRACSSLVFGVAWANLFARDCPRNNTGKLLLAHGTHNEP